MRSILYTLIVISLLTAACGQKRATIEGVLSFPEAGSHLYLNRIEAANVVMEDSVKLGSGGEFRFKPDIDMPVFFLLGTEDMDNSLTILLEPGDNLYIKAHYDSLFRPSELKGSEGTLLVMEYDMAMDDARNRLSELHEIYMENVGSPDLDKILEELDDRSDEILKDLNLFSKEFIDRNEGSLVTLLVLYQQAAPGFHVFHPFDDYDYFVKVESALSARYPESDLVRDLSEQVEEVSEMMGTDGVRRGVEPGSEAPEIALPAPNGEVVSLSSTRGKVVLLDFWASWCGDCRDASQYLTRAYSKYSDMGFTIYQVSLDSSREAWLSAIEEDYLGEWIHVSDLKYYSSEVVSLYDIQSVPFNLLLDRDGRVIGTGLTGEDLLNTLEIFMNQ